MGNPQGQRRDFEALERRRLEGLRLFSKGVPQAQITRELRIARQTVSRWVRQYRGRQEGAAAGGPGGPAAEAGRHATAAAGENTTGRPGSRRLPYAAVDLSSRGRGDRSPLWRPLSSGPCVEAAAGHGVQLPEAGGAGGGARREGRWAMEAQALACHSKNARREGRTIVFIDESGISQRPHRVRTWAPRGVTPVLQDCFNGKTLSAVVGGGLLEFLFPAASGADPRAAGGGISGCSEAAGARTAAGDPGPAASAPQRAGAALCRGQRGPDRGRVPAGLCPGVESRRVSLGLLEAA
ncbi:MAG: hypothetical protein KatS3mg004_3734 [Bryobacteraceae bacterium]|nr:MAG: hypothetical protein KatS3mg004_3734 [Bryobacteraceae bacterium]